MENLHWPMSVLSRAVHFKNLTSASAHVGISQPQLSRIISQLEKELDVALLDRTSKRNSNWTPVAIRIGEVYAQNSRKLKSSLNEILEEQMPTHITIGSLEGIGEEALKLAHQLFQNSKVNEVELDIYDQTELEEKFSNGDLDIIFTSRDPGKQKYSNRIEIGYQSLEKIDNSKEFSVMSGFEYGRIKKKPENQILISNSLSIRKQWLARFGGTGIQPSSMKPNKGRDNLPVLIIGSSMLNETIWKNIKSHYST